LTVIVNTEIAKLISKDRLNYICRMLDIQYNNVYRTRLHEGFLF